VGRRKHRSTHRAHTRIRSRPRWRHSPSGSPRPDRATETCRSRPSSRRSPSSPSERTSASVMPWMRGRISYLRNWPQRAGSTQFAAERCILSSVRHRRFGPSIACFGAASATPSCRRSAHRCGRSGCGSERSTPAPTRPKTIAADHVGRRSGWFRYRSRHNRRSPTPVHQVAIRPQIVQDRQNFDADRSNCSPLPEHPAASITVQRCLRSSVRTKRGVNRRPNARRNSHPCFERRHHLPAQSSETYDGNRRLCGTTVGLPDRSTQARTLEPTARIVSSRHSR